MYIYIASSTWRSLEWWSNANKRINKFDWNVIYPTWFSSLLCKVYWSVLKESTAVLYRFWNQMAYAIWDTRTATKDDTIASLRDKDCSIFNRGEQCRLLYAQGIKIPLHSRRGPQTENLFLSLTPPFFSRGPKLIRALQSNTGPHEIERDIPADEPWEWIRTGTEICPSF